MHPLEPPTPADRVSQLEAAIGQIERRLRLLELRLADIGVPTSKESRFFEAPAFGRIPEPSPVEAGGTPPASEVPPPGPGIGAGPPSEGARPVQPPSIFTAELEVLIGTSWLNRLGILAIIAAVAYFLKFSFDNNWVGPSGRVGLTLLGGTLLLAAGEHYQRRRLSVFAQGLSGGGAAVLYLGIFSAFAIYRLIGFAPAFGTMVLITIATMALALRYDSLAIATLGLLGGFATPFLLGGPPAAPGVAHRADVGVYLYFLLLDAGAYELVRRRRWWKFGAVSLAAGFLAPVILAQSAIPQPSAAAVYFLLLTIATLLLSKIFTVTALAWAALAGGFLFDSAAGFSIFFSGLPLIALGYYAVITVTAITIGERRNWEEVVTVAAVVGILVGQVRYPGSSPGLLVPHFAYLLVVGGAAAAAAARRGWPSSALFVMLATGAGILGDVSAHAATWVGGVTLLFFLFSVTAAFAGRTQTELWMRTSVLSAMVYAAQLSLIFGPGRRDELALFAAGLAAYHFGLSQILLRRRWPVTAVLVYLGLAMTFVTIAIPLKLQQAAIPLAWAAECVALAWAAARAQNLWAARAAAMVGALVTLRLVLYETPTIATASRVVFSAPGFVFASGIVALAVAARLLRPVRRPSQVERAIPAAMGAAAAGLLLWWGGWEINGMADRAEPASWLASARHAALSAWLTVYGFGLVVVGVTRDVSGLRWAGIGLLAVTIFKVLSVDLSELQVVYRIGSLGVLGVLLLLASLVYGRYQQRLGPGDRP